MASTSKKWRVEHWVLLLGVTAILGWVFVQPYFEMRAFNKFRKASQPEATYVDAMFGELRITSE